MLSEDEKREMLEDAQNPLRKEMFARSRDINVKSGHSLDEYIRFLNGIQKVFGSFKIRREKSVTGNNKL